MSDWISVAERLPEPGYQQYLCYGRDYRMPRVDCYYAARYNGWGTGWTIPGVSGLPVTHWKPLDEPPKQD